MDTNIGTSQASLVLNSNGTTSLQRYYFTRFVSPPLAAQTLTAQTWTYNYATVALSTSSAFPAPTAASVPVRVVCYVWRPSTTSVYAFILDGNGGNGRATTTERSQVGTFTGSGFSGVQDGDVICFEVWFEITQTNTVATTDTFYYDGTTVNATNFFSVSNHASFIETPQNLAFSVPVTCTPTGKTIYNKTTKHG